MGIGHDLANMIDVWQINAVARDLRSVCFYVKYDQDYKVSLADEVLYQSKCFPTKRHE